MEGWMDGRIGGERDGGQEREKVGEINGERKKGKEGYDDVEKSGWSGNLIISVRK